MPGAAPCRICTPSVSIVAMSAPPPHAGTASESESRATSRLAEIWSVGCGVKP